MTISQQLCTLVGTTHFKRPTKLIRDNTSPTTPMIENVSLTPFAALEHEVEKHPPKHTAHTVKTIRSYDTQFRIVRIFNTNS